MRRRRGQRISFIDRKLGKQPPGLALGVPLFALPLLGLAVLISSLPSHPQSKTYLSPQRNTPSSTRPGDTNYSRGKDPDPYAWHCMVAAFG
jgi:hypothetical protein